MVEKLVIVNQMAINYLNFWQKIQGFLEYIYLSILLKSISKYLIFIMLSKKNKKKNKEKR
jgi:hypothetical protein